MAPGTSPAAAAEPGRRVRARAFTAAVAAVMLVIAAAAGPLCAQGVPYIYQPLVPTSAAPGGGAFTLTVSGTGFEPGAVVDWDGSPLATSYISSSRLSAAVPAEDIAAAQVATITAHNPGVPVASNYIYFPVANPVARLGYANAPGSPVWLGHTGNYLNQPYSIAAGAFEPGQDGIVMAMNVPLSSTPGFLDLYSGAANGTFSAQSASNGVGVSPSNIAVGDFTGNGRLDVATANNGDVTVLLNNGGGTFTPAPAIPLIGGPDLVNSVVTADFNHDGKLDLAVATDNGIFIFLGNGDGTFTPAPGSPFDPGPDFFGLAVGDFNGDGNLDLAAGDFGAASVRVFLGKGDGTFAPAPGSPISIAPGDPTGIAAADFNGDGKLDLATATGGVQRLAVLLGNGDGTFTQVADPVPDLHWQDQIFANIDGWAVQVGDFLANGKLDIAASEQDVQSGTPADFVYTYLGNGDGTYTPSDFSMLLPQSPFSSFTTGPFGDSGLIGYATASDAQNWLNVLLLQPAPGPPPDFSIVARSGDSSATVAQGATATYSLGVVSLNGFTGPVYMTCSAGLPTNSVCSWSDPDAPVATGINDGVGAGVVVALPSSDGPDLLPTLTVYTAAPGQPAPALGATATPPGAGLSGAGASPLRRLGLLAGALALALLALIFAAERRWQRGGRGFTWLGRRHAVGWGAPAFALLAALAWASCGAAPTVTKAKVTTPPGGTPTGTYTITLTCTAYEGSPLAFSHTLPLTLTVTPATSPAAATPGGN